ncbi:MAG: hypothetical protein Dasosvirus6_8 [Dasosvirus sp.]|uniref:Ankyrin repeat protein n=1 Tax=Dasosvirus sp. TaxID=2487764 RepID=A0A3G4ZRK3_9VIRU|nr:MAG: hypothetical protein Dasosvirus6_8 [Dasosvirus sp.]
MKIKEYHDILRVIDISKMFSPLNLQIIYEDTIGFFTSDEKFKYTFPSPEISFEQYDLFYEIGQNNYEYVVQKYNVIWDYRKKQHFFAKALSYADMRIIRFLEQKYNVKKNFIENEEFFKEILQYNKNVDVIKYAIDELKINPGYHHYEKTYLDIACEFNCLNVVKYLIEEQKMDPNRESDIGSNCFVRAILNDNQKVIEYLSNQMDIVYAIKYICRTEHYGWWVGIYGRFQIQRFSRMIFAFRENYFAVNYLIEYIINIHGDEFCSERLYLEKINPLMLQRYLLPRLRIRDPFTLDYATFTKHVDSLNVKIPINIENIVTLIHFL